MDLGRPGSVGAGESVLVVGPGALGCLYAGLLVEAGAQAALLDHRPERAREISATGVRLVEAGIERTVAVPCLLRTELTRPATLVLVLVKAFDTAAAAAEAAPAIGPGTAVLTLQNGLGNYQKLARVVPLQRLLAGSTTAGATLLGAAKVLVAARGEVTLGSPTGDEALANRAAALLGGAGLTVTVAADVDAVLWRKALVNAAINPLTALTDRRNGELLSDPGLRRLLARVAEETHAIGERLGIAWGRFDPAQSVEQVCRATAGNRSSMLQDVTSGRRTEIGGINGYIAAQAAAIGMPAPLNEALAALVGGIARGQSGEATTKTAERSAQEELPK